MNLPNEIQLSGTGLRPTIATVQQALRFIDLELPIELKQKSRWIFARELLAVAAKTRKKRDVLAAIRQLKQALCNDGLLRQVKASATKGAHAFASASHVDPCPCRLAARDANSTIIQRPIDWARAKDTQARPTLSRDTDA
jgi:hypothetical protein